MSKKHPVIGFTIGDPAGIGPKITLDAIQYFLKMNVLVPVLFGSKEVFDHHYLKEQFSQCPIVYDNGSAFDRTDCIYFVNSDTKRTFPLSKPSQAAGALSYKYIKTATEYALNHRIDALVTGPISKESFSLANIPFTGHTTLLKALTQSKQIAMAFHSPKLNVVLATIHVSLKEVSSVLDRVCLSNAIVSAVELMTLLGKKTYHIAVAGLNPHASENGLFGNEEDKLIAPLIAEFQQKGHCVSGPYPADTVFLRSVQGEFDCVVAMYHDQGLIPVKLLGFHEAVNVSIGLPFIRTSPDHGTAFDIAYKRTPNPDSMIAATQCALKMYHRYDA